jgi:hypothetical protein
MVANVGNPDYFPTVQDILAQVTAPQNQLTILQNKIIALTNQVQALQQAVPPARGGRDGGGSAGGRQGAQVNQGGALATAFALMLATTDLIGLIEYSSKLGQSIYKQGCNKLANNEAFAMTPSTTTAFVNTFKSCCNIMEDGAKAKVLRMSQSS